MGEVNVVGDEDLGLREVVQQFDQVSLAGGIEEGGRLVENQDLGLHGEDAAGRVVTVHSRICQRTKSIFLRSVTSAQGQRSRNASRISFPEPLSSRPRSLRASSL